MGYEKIEKFGRCTLKTSFGAFALIAICAQGHPAPAPPQSVPADHPQKTIIIGFVGGILKDDDPIRNEITVATRLGADYKNSAVVKVFKNEKRREAHAFILQTLANEPNRLATPEQRRNALVIIYGHSWGASKAIALARLLQKDGIPVLLTIQVDSVRKMHDRNDSVIPPNVREAVNFYQSNGMIHGRKEIRAEDPNRTKILGNFRMDYKEHPVQCKDYPWWEKTLTKTHAEIECDPRLWSQIEALIRTRIGDSGEQEN